ncbi:flagellar biosynthetic protein FliR [Geomesophilobacter sediminis]|uniref:Flagellar biosynthetic protein FliR n=1 Tax=Geomesophilobacter sediminis TaxID=2798584 RepID=A0A8J7LYG5_9BACT|nr:flagellar biosynthetic protein FliR [Geomesophilobacter sediminis]MBJ6724762.1 flagellar biosynthetic protein FliR [Geomesophilobacter sediminis]
MQLFDSFPIGALDQVVPFLLVLTRVAGLFSAIPMFGGRIVPNRVKTPLFLTLAILIYPIVKPLVHVPPANDVISLGLLVISEMLIGITLGFLAQIIFAAVEFCGNQVGMQIGLSMASLFDPNTQASVPTMAVFQGALATLVFLALDVHHVFIRGIVESYRLVPIGSWHTSPNLYKMIVEASSGVLVIAVKLAAPVAVALLATSVVLGIVARAFPQMNVFMVSMPLNIGVGLLILGLSLPVFFRVLQGAFGTLSQQMIALFRLLA